MQYVFFYYITSYSLSGMAGKLGGAINRIGIVWSFLKINLWLFLTAIDLGKMALKFQRVTCITPNVKKSLSKITKFPLKK